VSVKNAAALMGVGRPALSNLLNGKAALTPEMALRLEKAFGAKAQELLALQAAHDEYERRDQAKEIAVRTYVQTFLGITARQIYAWSEQIRARSELPVLLRRLIHATGTDLAKVDFPAFDNAQRHGWDGYVATDTATPWIPRGLSGWEFGCNQNPNQKAEADYGARTSSIPSSDRNETTFVFVTPKNWPGKENWAREKRKKGEWKDVRVYDASDLEQWLEQSVAVQAWSAEKLGNGAPGTLTLEACWKQWAEVTNPPLSKLLFRAAIEAHKEKLRNWLREPPEQPFVIAADSEVEALAFLACALEALGSPPGQYYDRAIVLQTVDALKRATATALDFVAVVSSPDAELASAGLHRIHHMLVIRRRNDVAHEPDIALDLVDHQTFREALAAMGLPDEDYARYARETGHSPTILRRRLSEVPAIHTPAWSADKALARKLIPLSFAGAWDSETPADCEILRLLAHSDNAEIEHSVAELLTVADAPMWSVGKFRGVTSKIDVMFATKALITNADLENFFFVAQYVLSETDPALELSPNRRWAANLYGKTRDHSAGLRMGLCETLVLLAVHGNALFGERLSMNVEARINGIVRGLLTPLDSRTWASQKGNLPQYAEAAPDVFLDVLEEDLASDQPKVHELLRSAESMPFGDCPRSDLLWALETLAWRPERLVRVSVALAKLAAVRITDNWTNKPEGSLGAIYRCWMPQTAASIDERNAALEILCQRFPHIGWRLCVAQFSTGSGIGHYSARPHWGNDASGAGQPTTADEACRAASKALRIALAWPSHDEKTLGDLVECLQGIGEPDQQTVWDLIRAWAATNPGDAAKHELRERIRRFALTRRARIRGVTSAAKSRAQEAYDLLGPRDVVMRHLWLFAQNWVEESADEFEDDNLNYQKREEHIAALRKAALQEIWSTSRYDGIMRLSELGDADGVIGWLLADGVISTEHYVGILDQLAGQTAPPSENKIDHLLSAFLGRLDGNVREQTTTQLLSSHLRAGTAGADKAIRVLKCSPLRAETWKHLDALPEDLRQRYWRETYVRWVRQDANELNTIVDRLMEVQRPRAAFNAVHLDFEKIDGQRLISLLRAVATSSAEPAKHFRFGQYEISQAFKSLKSRPSILPETLAQLEFMYVEVLDHSKYGIPTLERELAAEPMLFMQLIALVYHRSDDGQDPPEWATADDERRAAAAKASYSALRRAKRIPGTRDDGSVDGAALLKWVEDVRALGRTYGRVETTDTVIGELLAKAPTGIDGVWPCEGVRLALDTVASKRMVHGMCIGCYNLRGVQWRGEGGQQERDLAGQYRGWAKAIGFQWPFTASLLEQLARMYDRDAVWHDADANVRKRLNY
jgi:addiction module HigA family antidote